MIALRRYQLKEVAPLPTVKTLPRLRADADITRPLSHVTRSDDFMWKGCGLEVTLVGIRGETFKSGAAKGYKNVDVYIEWQGDTYKLELQLLSDKPTVGYDATVFSEVNWCREHLVGKQVYIRHKGPKEWVIYDIVEDYGSESIGSIPVTDPSTLDPAVRAVGPDPSRGRVGVMRLANFENVGGVNIIDGNIVEQTRRLKDLLGNMKSDSSKLASYRKGAKKFTS